MLSLADIRAITFDCYGTLIDWESGILGVLCPLLSARRVRVDDGEILRVYAALEAEQERGDYRPYREVLARVMAGFASHFGVSFTESERAGLAATVAHWRPFADTVPALRDLARKFDLVICSNIDDDLIGASVRHLNCSLRYIVTAQMCRSYKPDPRHLRVALALLDLPPAQVLHVAESRYHDIAPAKAIGMPTIWVNRHAADKGPSASGTGEVRPDYEVRDLTGVVELLEGRPRGTGRRPQA